MVLARRQELVRLTEAAVAVALSVLLGNIRLVELPNGGSIALAVLPLLALAIARGMRTTLLAGCCAGAAHALAGGTIIHPAQLALDYFASYAALAVAGGVPRPGGSLSRRALVLPITVAMALHLATMVTSGAIFFAPVAGDAALGYSLAYNAATVVPETLLAIWLVPPLVLALARANPADSWRRGLLPPPRLEPRVPRRVVAVQRRVLLPHGHGAPRPPATFPQLPVPRRAPTPIVRGAPFAGRVPWSPARAATADRGSLRQRLPS